MLFTTTTQYVALAVALVAGWLFGLASHPGGRRWKERYTTERDAHAASRRDHEARVADTRRDHDGRLAEANARIAELERENARLAKAAPVTAATIAPAAHDRVVDLRSTDARAPRTVYPAGSGRGWFNWRNRTPAVH